MSAGTYVTPAYVEMYRDMGALRFRGMRIQTAMRNALQSGRHSEEEERRAFSDMYTQTQVMIDAALAIQRVLERLWDNDHTPERAAFVQYSPASCVVKTWKRINQADIDVYNKIGETSLTPFKCFRRKSLPTLLERFRMFAAEQFWAVMTALQPVKAMLTEEEIECMKSS